MSAVKSIAKKLFEVWGNPEEDTAALRHNFERYGAALGAFNMRDFEMMARQFYADNVNSNDPHCSKVTLSDGRTGIDYNGKLRGIYDDDGEPLAFYIPDFRAEGFSSRTEEMAHWRTGFNTKALETV